MSRWAPVVMFLGIGSLGACNGPAPSACLDFGTDVRIADNHPSGSHVLVVEIDEIVAGEPREYDIQGNNTGHGHTVSLTAAHFASLARGEPVTIESSDTGAAGNDHTHTVTISCASE